MPSTFSISAQGSVFIRLRGVRTERIASRDPSLFGLVTRNCARAKTIAQKTRHPTEVLGTNAEYFSMSVECREAHLSAARCENWTDRAPCPQLLEFGYSGLRLHKIYCTQTTDTQPRWWGRMPIIFRCRPWLIWAGGNLRWPVGGEGHNSGSACSIVTRISVPLSSCHRAYGGT